jgi:hypothetical protein
MYRARLAMTAALLGLTLFNFSPGPLYAQNPDVKQILIHSAWGGLGKPASVELNIVSDGHEFRLGHKGIDAAFVQAFITALRQPAIIEPSLDNLGLTHEWLASNHNWPNSMYEGGPHTGADNQREYYRHRFEDPKFISKLLPQIFHSFHTDDYPGVNIQVDFADGTTEFVSSHAQAAFMLPWKVETSNATFETYNASISRALAALMPKKAVNRERIAGEGLTEAIKEAADRALEPELNRLDAMNRAEAALAEVKTRYSIGEAEINSFHHPEYGIAWADGQPHETNLHLELMRGDFPPNVTDAVVLEFRDGKVLNVDQFMSSMSKYEGLALSVEWLSAYLLRHKNVPIRISYVHDLSIGAKAMSVFAADMGAIHRDDLVREVAAHQSEAALLITGRTYAESYWIVLPVKRMVLWRYNGPSGLLKWKPSDFPTSECADYGVPFGGCVGAAISPDGDLIK